MLLSTHATFSALLHSLSIAFPLLACHLQLSSSASFGTTERIPGARWPPNSLEKKPLDAFACVGLILLVGKSLVAAHGKTTQTHITWIAFNLTRSYITSQSARNFPQRFLNNEYIINHPSWGSTLTVKPLATSAHLGACVIVANFRLDLDNILIFSTWERGSKPLTSDSLLVALRENRVTLIIWYCIYISVI